MSTINLLPNDFLDRRQRRRATVICSALFAVVMAGVVAAMLASEQSYRRTLEVRERVNADYVEAAKLIQQMQQLSMRKDQLLEKARRSASLMERLPRSYLLAMVTNSLPEHASLESVDLEMTEVHRKAAADKQTPSAKYARTKKKRAPVIESDIFVKMTVTGYAATDVEVARLIAALARNPLPHRVDLVFSEEKSISATNTADARGKTANTVTARRFQIEIELSVNADPMEALGAEDRLAVAAEEVVR